jgi:hypothetical protein
MNNVSISDKEIEERDFDSAMCEWVYGLVGVWAGVGMFDSVAFVNCSEGALSVLGSNLTFANSSFKGGFASLRDFPSMKRNDYCALSNLSLMNLHADSDGFNVSDPLWIEGSTCSVSMTPSRPSYFFIPTITSIGFDNSTTGIDLSYTGTLLLPCHLSSRIDWKNGSETEHTLLIPIAPDSETHAAASVDQAEIEKHDEFDMYASLSYPNGNVFSITAEIKIRNDVPKVIPPAETQPPPPAWVYGVAGGGGAVLIVVVVAFLVVFGLKRYRRSKLSDAELRKQLLDANFAESKF